MNTIERLVSSSKEIFPSSDSKLLQTVCGIAALGCACYLAFKYFAPSKKLSVEKVDSKDYPKVEKLATSWKNIARDQIGKTSGTFQERSVESCAVCLDISREIKKPFKSRLEFYLCKDSSFRPQGLMCIRYRKKQNSVEIEQLVTHPHNLLDSRQSIKNVGRTLVNVAEKRAKDLRVEKIFLYSMDTAQSFYKKLGYVDEELHLVKKLKPAK